MKPTYKQVTEFAKLHVQRQWNERGDRFADDQQQVDAIKSDVWAWTDLWEEEVVAHWGLPVRTRLYPNHWKKTIQIDRPLVCRA